MGGLEVVDPEVHMQLLLGCPVRPIGGDVVRRKLDAEPPLAVDHHAVPVIVRVDRAPQELGPEAALGGEIGSVEHDNLSPDLHADILAQAHHSSAPTGSGACVPASSGLSSGRGR